ncbi:HepT-like ribonuclease domain-containing protein [Spirosoma aerophilum]
MTLAEFLNDSKTQDACVRQLEIAGEATKRLSKQVRERFTNIPWRERYSRNEGSAHPSIH